MMLYGMHDRCNLDVLAQPSWIVISEAIGHDPYNHNGGDYRDLEAAGHTVVVRLNNGYYPDGTIPSPEYYQEFAARCGNFVAASAGCRYWIIGNETNHSQERPHGQAISAENYADCYYHCREEIRARPGHSDDQVLVAAVAPWNIQTGPWLDYFRQVLLLAGDMDGICLHAYTHGNHPDLIFSNQTMDPPYATCFYHFRAYQDFLAHVPLSMRDIPVYITETDQDVPWADTNSGWVKNAYREIDDWNKAGGQPIHCLCLYRWAGDQWIIRDKPGVIADFLQAQQMGYQWPLDEEDNDMVEIDLFLVNPDFEQGFREIDAGEVKVADGWWPWWHETDSRPEFKDARFEVDPSRIKSGRFAQQWFVRWRTYTAGIYQQVEGVPVGKPLVFEAHVQAWSTDTEDSERSDGRLQMRIGIDPYGGTDPEGEDVVWCEAVPAAPMHPNEYVALRVEAVARSDRCTVFGWSQCEWRLSHNDAYMDTCRLFYLGDEDPGDPGEPGEPAQCGAQEAMHLGLSILLNADLAHAKVIEDALAEMDMTAWMKHVRRLGVRPRGMRGFWHRLYWLLSGNMKHVDRS